ncbi:MAG: hypothetical protein SVQ76_02505 [Candidatus Nanohaloarchaea archaeon]|nr:hypothetical protein [Candidatus Nanohaloarchaea archaeon]
MFEGLEKKEQYGLVGAAIVLLAVGFGAGVSMSGGSPTASIVASGDTDQIRQTVQSFMDKQMQRQKQKLAVLSQRSKNISASDLSIDAAVKSVEESKFDSLYRVTVTVTGTVPARTGGLQELNQEQVYYISADGRYLFQEPRDLKKPQQPTR